MTPLPVDAVLPAVGEALRECGAAVLVAPPGAGKTTRVAPYLLGAAWLGGQRILLLSPRRLAARAAAERMAYERGEPVGATIGYRTRLDSKVSAATRLEVLTEGIFTNLVQRDPELAGVGAVIFDEVHERSLDGDLGLALALDVRAALRPDLRLVAMSATLDGARFAALLEAPVIDSAGRAHPVSVRYLGRDPRERIEDAVARAVHAALAGETGSVLAFLPGVAEIGRTAERLRVGPDVDVHRLHGALAGGEQRAAIAPAAAGRRKVVLATSLAETSITIDGVRVVIDSGLARRPRFDRAAGMTRLVTERASLAAVTQRAGRAGRTAPGTAWRLWEAGATAGLPAFDPPAILESDLAGLVLELAGWGVREPGTLKWLDPPPAGSVAAARAQLAALGALDGDGSITAHGRALAALPLPPALAHMVIAGAARAMGVAAAEAAVLLGERGLGGNTPDLDVRRANWRRERGDRAQAARGLARRWARGEGDAAGLGPVLALGFPERLARRRRGGEGVWLMANGRAVRLDPAEPLAKAEWLAVAEASGAADGARVLSAAAIDAAEVRRLAADRIERRARVAFDPATGGVVAEETERLGAIVLVRRPLAHPDAALMAGALAAGVRAGGLALLPWDEAGGSLRARVAFLRGLGEALPDLGDAALLADLAWLLPPLAGARRLGAISPETLTAALRGVLGGTAARVDRLAPPRFATPAGTSHAIDYAADGGPAVEVRCQALFGLARHPAVADGRVPLTLRLTSPAGRPIQTTRDLPGFWAGSWRAVAKEMRGRYPRHPWPDDPANAAPTVRTKRAGG